MRLYEMLERVSEVVYQDNPSPLLTYLKNTLDDDGCFLRSRYGRRHEGEVADRELGEVGFIMVASNMPFSPKHVQFKSIKTGHISFIGDNVTDSRKAATNSYYEICGTDIVLMGVGNDHFVIISRHVNNIDIIEKLKDFSFRLQRTGARREHVMAYAPKCLQDQGYTQSVYLTRAIASIELYGDIRVLDANYDVHHKGDCWDNRQGMILYLNSKLHNHRDSHMTGYVISSMAALIATVARLNQNYKELHLVATAM